MKLDYKIACKGLAKLFTISLVVNIIFAISCTILIIKLCEKPKTQVEQTVIIPSGVKHPMELETIPDSELR